MLNPLVSIIIPVFNDEKYIIETLKSVQNQDYDNWECIIVNDGSSDDSEKIIQEFISFDNRFTYYYKTNSGVAETRNMAISKAKGTYILPLDSDDKISTKYLQKAVNEFTKDQKTKLVYCKAEFFGEQTGKFKLQKYCYENLILRNSIFCSAIFKREDFLASNGYDINLKSGLEDWEFWIRFLDTNSKVVCLNEVHFYYRIKEISRNKVHDDTDKLSEIHNYIFQKHQNKYEQILFKGKPKLDGMYDLVNQSDKFLEIKKSFSYKFFKAEKAIRSLF